MFPVAFNFETTIPSRTKEFSKLVILLPIFFLFTRLQPATSYSKLFFRFVRSRRLSAYLLDPPLVIFFSYFWILLYCKVNLYFKDCVAVYSNDVFCCPYSGPKLIYFKFMSELLRELGYGVLVCSLYIPFYRGKIIYAYSPSPGWAGSYVGFAQR